MGAYKQSHTSEDGPNIGAPMTGPWFIHTPEYPYIEFWHRSTIYTSEFRCMDTPMYGWTNPYIRAPMYGCRGMLRWAPTWVFFRLPMRQRIGTFIRSSIKVLFKDHSSNQCSVLGSGFPLPFFVLLIIIF